MEKKRVLTQRPLQTLTRQRQNQRNSVLTHQPHRLLKKQTHSTYFHFATGLVRPSIPDRASFAASERYLFVCRCRPAVDGQWRMDGASGATEGTQEASDTLFPSFFSLDRMSGKYVVLYTMQWIKVRQRLSLLLVACTSGYSDLGAREASFRGVHIDL